MTKGQIMIYGATGYTGKLSARLAHTLGQKPLLAARDAVKLRAIAEPLGLPWVALNLADDKTLDKALHGVDVVAHMAGPFSTTSKPMLDACLRTQRHYLDITGEIDVFEACAQRDLEAKSQGIMVMPGVGFDVVPSDCLAAHMKRRMPDATRLALGIAGLGGISRGTAKTMVEGVNQGTRTRVDGVIQTLKRAPTRQFDFGQGPSPSIGVGWGDVSTAYHSTGIPSIEVYFEAMPQLKAAANMGGFLRWLLSTPLAQRFLKSRIDRLPEGPTDEQRLKGRAILIGEASNAAGQTVRSRLATPEGYTLTAMTALAIAARVQAGDWKPGFMTPSKAYGADFILEFEGVRREDLNQ